MPSARVAFRPALNADFARIYGVEAEHIVGVAGDQALAWIGFKALDGRVWGMFGMLGPATPQQKRELFYAFRKVLWTKNELIHVAAKDAAAERLLALLGLTATNETYAGKRIWKWIPERSTC